MSAAASQGDPLCKARMGPEQSSNSFKFAVLAFVKYPVIFCGYMAAGIFRNLVISISRSGICRYP